MEGCQTFITDVACRALSPKIIGFFRLNETNDGIVQDLSPGTRLSHSVQWAIVQDSSTQQNEKVTSGSRAISITGNKRLAQSKTSSVVRAFNSISNIETVSRLSKTNSVVPGSEIASIKNHDKSDFGDLFYRIPSIQSKNKAEDTEIEHRQTQKRRRRRGLCTASPLCCIGSVFALLLLFAGLAALLVALLSNRTATVTSTSTTTITTATTTTTTTATTTTTTTATTTTTTTATTTTATTATTTTSSTTTSTSSTTATTTTETTTSTTSATTSTSTTTTTANPCVLVVVGTSNILYTVTSPNITSYYCLAYQWTSSITGLVTLAFELRQDPDYWYLDDVSVYNGTDEMLINGDFESGTLSPWVRTTPNGACSGVPGHICNSSPHYGSYALCDGSNGCADLISQSFMAIAAQVYNVTFWMKSGTPGSVIWANVTLS